jgi:hypothetical protein
VSQSGSHRQRPRKPWPVCNSGSIGLRRSDLVWWILRVTTDGTASTESNIIGMSMLQAESMDEALVMVEDHHHLHWAEDCEIVVLEEMSIPELESSNG